MSSPAKLFNKFRAAGTNERLDLTLFWRASEDPFKKPTSMWSESRYPQLTKENVAPTIQSSAGWMPKSMGRSVGVGQRHPVTMPRRHSRHYL